MSERANSPAPEHVRVDPGSIAIEDIKRRHPEAPTPVFSTMALEHGLKASGAAQLKKGFSWNPQMDLLWALGYPEVVFIVDGFPIEDTKEGILSYWNAEKRDFRWWRDRAESDYREAGRLDPGNLPAQINLARLLIDP